MNTTIRRILLIVGLLVLTVVLSSCGYFRRDANYGDTSAFPAAQTVYLVCSNECRAQGQCGTLIENQSTVVFLNRDRIATKSHTNLMPQNSAATVQELAASQQMVLETNNGAMSQMNFYKVSFQYNGTPDQGWVAGWCVADGVQ